MIPPTTMTATDPSYLLIWGGSAVTAQFAIQIAIRSGVWVIAVTSAKTQHLATSRGATHVIPRDGKSNNEIVSEIRAVAGDNITRTIDLVGTSTAAACLSAVSRSRSVLFAPLAMMSKETKVPENVTVQTVEMKKFVLDEGSKMFAHELNRLVGDGLVKLPKISVLEGGLSSIEVGLAMLKRGDLGGRKLIVKF